MVPKFCVSGTLMSPTSWLFVAAGCRGSDIAVSVQKYSSDTAEPSEEEDSATADPPTPFSVAFVEIPAGVFGMGSPDDELGRSDDEWYHEVTLSRSFWMGPYEVTQAEYEEIMEGADKLNPKVRDVMAKTAVVKKV